MYWFTHLIVALLFNALLVFSLGWWARHPLPKSHQRMASEPWRWAWAAIQWAALFFLTLAVLTYLMAVHALPPHLGFKPWRLPILLSALPFLVCVVRFAIGFWRCRSRCWTELVNSIRYPYRDE